VEKICIHLDYDPNDVQNDVMLVKLMGAAPLMERESIGWEKGSKAIAIQVPLNQKACRKLSSVIRIANPERGLEEETRKYTKRNICVSQFGAGNNPS